MKARLSFRQAAMAPSRRKQKARQFDWSRQQQPVLLALVWLCKASCITVPRNPFQSLNKNLF
jgi:hypothetical protein